mmetsp:Transcript_11536/g.40326  ORF Transcript_11536/g.40326 Transcript_11536/m.40326 type:complete len:382 (+) Transcript_11536:349-1494(+)
MILTTCGLPASASAAAPSPAEPAEPALAAFSTRRDVTVTSAASCHAKAQAVMQMPAATAVKRSTSSVTTVTTRMTTASMRRILRSACGASIACWRTVSGIRHAITVGTLPQSNVWKQTMTITPTSDAVGMILISGVATRMRSSTTMPATMPDRRYRPFAPLWQLIMDSPMVAPPPSVPKMPETKLPTDSATSCWFGFGFSVSVRSVTTSIVITASTRPAAAAMKAGPVAVLIVSQVKSGICPACWGSSQNTVGKPGVTSLMSPMVGVSAPNAARTMPNSMMTAPMMPHSDGGRMPPILGTLGMPTEKPTVAATTTHIHATWSRSRNVSVPGNLKLGICPMARMMARPLTKPIMAGRGTRRTNLATRKSAASAWKTEMTQTM